MSTDMTRGRRQPRQSDIARLVGVSQWTVSVVLNGAPGHRIPAETRERVLAAARELGYVPNAAARNLRGGRNRLIGVMTYTKNFELATETFLGYLVGLEREAARLDHDLIIFSSILGRSRRGDTQIYRDGTNRIGLADGSIIMGMGADLGELRRLAEEGYKFVYLGPGTPSDLPVASVVPDYAGGVETVVRAMAARGHTRLAYSSLHDRPHAGDRMQAERYHAYQECAAQLGMSTDPPCDAAHADMDRRWLERLVAAGVTGVIAESVAVAEALSGLTKSAGITIPGDLSVGVLEYIAGGPYHDVPWSCVPIDREKIGARAASRLVGMLDSGWPDPEDLTYERVPCEPLQGATIASPTVG